MGEQQDRQNRLMLDRALERAGRQPQFGTPAQRPDPLFPVGRAVTPRPAYEQFFDMPLADIPARTQEDIDAAEAFDLYAEREAQHRAERLAQGPLGAIAAPVTDWLTSPEARERMGEGVSHWLDGFTGGGSGARGEPDDTNTLGEIGDAFGDAARGAIRAPNPILAAPAVAAGASRVADAVSDWWSEDDNQLSLPWRMGGARSLFSIQPGAEGGPLRGYIPSFAEATTGRPWEESDWARRGLQFENARIDAATNNGQGLIAVDTSARDLYADEMTASGIDAALNLGFGVLDASEVLRAPRLLGASNDLAGEIAFYRSPDGFAETSIDPDGRIVHTYQGGYQSGEGSAGEAVASMRAAERALLDDIGQNQRPEYYWRPGPDDGGDPRLAQFYRNAFERRTPPGYTFSEAPDGTMRLARNAEAPADPTLQRPAEDSMLPAFDDDVWYHGTTEDFDSFDGATWITRNPERASTYALERDEDWLGANVRPLSTRGRVHQFPPDREKHTIPRREMNVYRDLGYDAVEMLSADGSIDRLVFDPANLAPRYGRPASESLDNTPLLSQAAPWLVGAGGGGAVGYILSGEADADDGEVDDDGFPLLPALGAGAGLTAAYLATRGRGGPARVLDESQSPAEPTRLYRGIVPDESRRSALGDRWWSTDPGVASSYAPDGVDGAYVMFGDIDENALNLLNVEPEPGTMFRSIPVETLTPDLRAAFPRSSETVSTHEIAAAAESLGYDGVTFRGIRDSGYGGAGEAYPGFGEGDPGRVVALFDEQAFDARSAPERASPSDWRQSVIPLGVGGAGVGGALLLGEDADAEDMSADYLPEDFPTDIRVSAVDVAGNEKDIPAYEDPHSPLPSIGLGLGAAAAARLGLSRAPALLRETLPIGFGGAVASASELAQGEDPRTAASLASLGALTFGAGEHAWRQAQDFPRQPDGFLPGEHTFRPDTVMRPEPGHEAFGRQVQEMVRTGGVELPPVVAGGAERATPPLEPVVSPSETLRLPRGDELEPLTFPTGFFSPETGEALFGEAARRAPTRPRKAFDQLAPSGQARRVGAAADQIEAARTLGVGEFDKGATAMRAMRERAAADPEFRARLNQLYPAIAAILFGGAAAGEMDGDPLGGMY